MISPRSQHSGSGASLHDVNDVPGFVAACINRSRLPIYGQDFEELKAEGVVIMYELAARFEPHRPGYEKPGRFSGFAARYLPGKLEDAWARLHPEHTRGKGEDGRRRWLFGAKPLSLDFDGDDSESREDSVEERACVATVGVPHGPHRFERIGAAVMSLPTAMREPAANYCLLTHEGHGIDHVARTIGARRGEVQQIRASIASALAAQGAR